MNFQKSKSPLGWTKAGLSPSGGIFDWPGSLLAPGEPAAENKTDQRGDKGYIKYHHDAISDHFLEKTVRLWGKQRLYIRLKKGFHVLPELFK